MYIHTWDPVTQTWNKTPTYIDQDQNPVIDECKCGFTDKDRAKLDSIPDNLNEILSDILRDLTELEQIVAKDTIRIDNLEKRYDGLEKEVEDLEKIISDSLDKLAELEDKIEEENSRIPVSSITLNQTSASVIEGQSITLVANIQPNDAYNKIVTWTSSDTTVATVNQSGVVIGVKVGNATISCTAIDGSNKFAICNLTVLTSVIPITSITLSQTSVNILTGENINIIHYISPTNATNQNVTWSSSNTSIATVNSFGAISGISAGNCIITCTSSSNPNIKATCNTTIRPRSVSVTGITVTPQVKDLTRSGETFNINVNVTPSNATNKIVTYSVNNSGIVSINKINDSSYNVTSLTGYGRCYITFTTQDGNKSAGCQIYIEAPTINVTGITVSPSSKTISVGENYWIRPTITPSNADNQNVYYTSSNTVVATVAPGTGSVNGKSPGNAIITCTTNDGNYKAYCNITVASISGSREFTSPGTYSWTVPSGVSSVRISGCGGGGGGGGGSFYNGVKANGGSSGGNTSISGTSCLLSGGRGGGGGTVGTMISTNGGMGWNNYGNWGGTSQSGSNGTTTSTSVSAAGGKGGNTSFGTGGNGAPGAGSYVGGTGGRGAGGGGGSSSYTIGSSLQGGGGGGAAQNITDKTMSVSPGTTYTVTIGAGGAGGIGGSGTNGIVSKGGSGGSGYLKISWG